MAHTRDEVIAAVESSFPTINSARVLELLDTYGVESYERERERTGESGSSQTDTEQPDASEPQTPTRSADA